ncbi:MAG: thioredoxin-disulfide reductase [Planctomycetes bacterium]|nr:thioredoxin-disulfide reductase [Planctomycetota bacterium]
MRHVIIIGSGPAGYTAAVYTARANLKPLMLVGGGSPDRTLNPGGQLMFTTEVENFPGFPEGVQGPDLMAMFEKQAVRFGTDIEYATVTKVDFSHRPFRVMWEGGAEEARAVIISTGAKSRLLGLPNDTELLLKGWERTCATCDGAFYKGQELVCVGGGDSCMEESNFLTHFASKVTVVHRRDALRASKIMQDRARKNPKIAWALDSVVKEFVPGPDPRKMRGVVVEHVKTGDRREIAAAAVFVAVGHLPSTEVFRGQIELDEVGYIVPKQFTYTSVEGVFAAGDCVDHRYRQAITAAGMGCAAAIDCERWLEAQGGGHG